MCPFATSVHLVASVVCYLKLKSENDEHLRKDGSDIVFCAFFCLAQPNGKVVTLSCKSVRLSANYTFFLQIHRANLNKKAKTN